jgi:uncharacterized C2H2 Zn-finger protein
VDGIFEKQDRESVCSTPTSSPASSIHSTPTFHSPYYFTGFDRLSISSPLSISAQSSPYDRLYRGSPVGSPGLSSPNKKRSSPDCDKLKSPKKPKAARKINFDEDKTSPVSGTIIKDFSDSEDEGHVSGDIDSSLNFVEVTPEAKAELEKIENKIGDYNCQLCKEHFEDAFQLAQHRCSRIVHVEYRCPECDKVFNCPANLASHRRWHKPRPQASPKSTPTKITSADSQMNQMMTSSLSPVSNVNVNNDMAAINMRREYEQTNLNEMQTDLRLSPTGGQIDLRASPMESEGQFECETCGKRFRRQAYLRKHIAGHNTDDVPYPCQYCGKILRSEAARSKHVLQHTIATRDYMCSVCGDCFPNKITLEKHTRMHTSEVFACKYCPSTFYSSPGLTRHINKCHPSENRQVILLQMPVNAPC